MVLDLSSCLFVTFSYCVLGQVWYLIVSIPDLCLLSYFFSYIYTELYKNKVSTQKPSVSSVKKPVQSVNVEPSALDIDKSTSLEISQLRELLGVSIQDEGPSIFDLYGD